MTDSVADFDVAEHLDDDDETKRIKFESRRNKIIKPSGFGKPSVYHGLIVIFLEFFAWGLLTNPIISVLNQTFPSHTFLMNGVIHGIKGLLTFLSSPLLGAYSDIWGRKFFLLLTVFFTCCPIPLMKISPMWYFALLSISGLFSVTFSVVYAYVADVTDENSRSTAYGLVTATFAASLITSPAIGAHLTRLYSENFIIALSSAVAILDLLFIFFFVPESLPERLRTNQKISWNKVDPFGALRNITHDRFIYLVCFIVLLSYLPEAGQYSCFFVYLRLMLGFSEDEVAYFIAFIGILSCIAQTALLACLQKYFGAKETIMVGLFFQIVQLAAFGIATSNWVMWFAGGLAALSSVTYPSISAFVSVYAKENQQGLVQGMVNGVRGLCNGLGPALFGFTFYLFNVDLGYSLLPLPKTSSNSTVIHNNVKLTYSSMFSRDVPGPPFLFGAFLATIALMFSLLLPNSKLDSNRMGIDTRTIEQEARLLNPGEDTKTNIQTR
ncbi:unnamed protein product [Rotaria socialis]|uniref:Major facilitator superfamily (MFS) profile domain-containing protein n=2 Tax=Rotaria socialis TaxID=392032 RepID=A0A818P742_9BILA|nr:unnamed protein product [Rotaria socialis]CAF3461648.1 unnamed protein product [Rotaria socialis]CAF3616712.1 unnamed protein product [Rotaria socialis]CAF4136483.1 unnamed protein product [Rotaria socialis]CAF4150697.1 unnamed protein product [Rotaria socialis]